MKPSIYARAQQFVSGQLGWTYDGWRDQYGYTRYTLCFGGWHYDMPSGVHAECEGEARREPRCPCDNSCRKQNLTAVSVDELNRDERKTVGLFVQVPAGSILIRRWENHVLEPMCHVSKAGCWVDPNDLKKHLLLKDGVSLEVLHTDYDSDYTWSQRSYMIACQDGKAVWTDLDVRARQLV